LTIIRADRGWFRFDVRTLWRYRDLLWLFVRRDLILRYRQTFLGPLWLIIQPLTMTGVLTALVKITAWLPTDGQPPPLFFMSVLTVWTYFSQVVLKIGHVFMDNEYIFRRIYFPRLIAPLAISISDVFATVIQLLIISVLLLYYVVFGHLHPPPPFGIVLILLSMVQLVAFSLGVGLLIASTTAKYRDLATATPFLLQVGLFLTPVIYPFSAIPQQFRILACALNPLAAVSDMWRMAVLGSGALTLAEWAASVASTVLVLALGVLAFQHVERTAADTI
jgi:lipopolysaccharide transport system permease protein